MLSHYNKLQIRDSLLGTCSTGSNLAEIYNIDPNEIDEIAADTGIERCEHCEYWFEDGDLINEDCEVVGCSDCRTK